MSVDEGKVSATKPRVSLYANYEYTLTSAQQSAIQVFLRLAVSKGMQRTPEWELLHNLTYAQSWTEKPKYKVNQSPAKQLDFMNQVDDGKVGRK